MIQSITTNIDRLKIFGVILILFTIVVIWSIPQENCDLAISLAAGHDVLSGHLNKPDDWSFSTGGNVWLNQNWGAGVIFFLANKVFGDTGLLVVKLLLLTLSALFLGLALKEIKVPLLMALTVTAAIMISMNVSTLLRPNLFTIALLPLELWLLYKTSNRPHLIWLVVLVTIFWANTHAGFIYGLGIQFLWTAYRVIPQVRAGAWKNKRHGIRNTWPLIAGAPAALLGAGLVNPFGLANLTFPFIMVKSGAWRIMADWQPVWAQVIPSLRVVIINFIIILCLILILLGAQLAYKLRNRNYLRTQHNKTLNPNAHAREVNIININAFDLAIALVSTVMAINSNRFIVIALIMLAPILAKQLVWLVRFIKFAWILPVLISGVLLIYGIIMMSDNFRNYQPENPFKNTGSGSLNARMNYDTIVYDYQLASFINKNKISGNVISPWTWEGFLRLNCPRLKIFIGGRAQQIYNEETLNRYLYITGQDVPSFHGRNREEVLDNIDAHLIIANYSDESKNLILTALNCGNWVIVYADDSCVLLANTKWPATAALTEQCANDTLSFENSSTKAMSKVAFILSRPSLWKTKHVIELFTEALNKQPLWFWSYQMLDMYCRSNARQFSARERVIGLMDRQLTCLEKMPLTKRDAVAILTCRMYLADKLSEVAKNSGQLMMYDQKQNSFLQAKQLYEALHKKWQQVLIQ